VTVIPQPCERITSGWLCARIASSKQFILTIFAGAAANHSTSSFKLIGAIVKRKGKAIVLSLSSARCMDEPSLTYSAYGCLPHLEFTQSADELLNMGQFTGYDPETPVTLRDTRRENLVNSDSKDCNYQVNRQLVVAYASLTNQAVFLDRQSSLVESSCLTVSAILPKKGHCHEEAPSCSVSVSTICDYLANLGTR
jgi:hypothetical protein